MKESTKALAAFEIYRDLGADRSLMKVAEKVREKYGKSAVNSRVFERWSSQHNWVVRAKEWDLEKDEAFKAGTLKATEEMASRHVKMARKLQEKGMRELQLIDCEKAGEAGKLVVDGMKMERLAHGQPDTIQQVEGAVTYDDFAKVFAATRKKSGVLK